MRLITLKDEMLDIEMETVEVLEGLLQEFDRNYSEISDTNKGHYNAYFSQVRPCRNSPVGIKPEEVPKTWVLYD